MKITLLRIISVVATAAAQQKTALAQKSARSFSETGKIALLLAVSAAILSALPNAEAAESGSKKRTLVEVLPFEPSVEGIGFWLLDKALDEIGNETWAEVKQSIKDSWAEEIDPYKDDWASNKALEPYWYSGEYNLTRNQSDTTIIVSFQGQEHLDSTAKGEFAAMENGAVTTHEKLVGAAAAQYIDAEGMNLDGYYYKYQFSVRGFGDWNNDGVKTWSRWYDVSGNEWSWIGHGSFDKAAARAEVQGWNTAEREYDLSSLIHSVDETWSVGKFYFNTVLTMDPRVHPNVVQHDGTYIVTITGEYTDVEYACCDSDGTGSAEDVGNPMPIREEHTCQFNQSHLVEQHGIRFTLGDNQRVIDMDAKGAAERRAVKHDVKGKFRVWKPVYGGEGGRNVVGFKFRDFEEKVSEEYQIEEKKFRQPGQTEDSSGTTE